MVTLIKYGNSYNTMVSEISGLSTDTKPTTTVEGLPIQNGSVFIETDTGKRFMFDQENTTWYEQ